ncbi:MAG: PHP domain-containing protein [Phycisphaeraceae bacterium]
MAIADHVASYDLHLHTCFSYDGQAQAAEHFARARELGVGVIAITEHHNMDSLDEVRDAAARSPGVRAIPAAELTVTTSSFGNVDLLCYGLPIAPRGKLEAVLHAYHDWQREAGAKLSAGLVALGCDFDDARRLELLKTYRPERAIARQGATHVKNGVLRDYVIERGWADDEGGYGELMRRAHEAVTPPPYPDPAMVADAVHDVGGVVAIAHPQRYFQGADRERMDALRIECGLDAIECAHPSVEPEYGAVYEAYCGEHGLLCVAGSDCHDTRAVERNFARHGGKAGWAEALLERLTHTNVLAG